MALEYSEKLGRKIRKDPWPEIGQPTYVLLRRALQEGRAEESSELLAYVRVENANMYNGLGEWLFEYIRFLTDSFGPSTARAAVKFATSRCPEAAEALFPGLDAEAIVQETRESWPQYEDLPVARMYAELQEAIGRAEEQMAESLIACLISANRSLHDALGDWHYAAHTYVADHFGEDALYQSLRYCAEKVLRPIREGLLRLTVEEMVQQRAESMRAHYGGPDSLGGLSVREEEDRYVMTFDPCGSGGKMLRGMPGSPSRTGPPFNLGRTAVPHPWSWSKAGVQYYCTHCCIMNEIMPIEWGGAPLRIHENPDSPESPCVWYVYKDAGRVPSKFYERVGKRKPGADAS